MRCLCAVAATLMLSVVSSTSPADAQIAFIPDTSQRISVDGLGEASGQPDIATVSLGVYALEKDLEQAKDQVDGVMARLLDLAADLGVETADLKTSAVSVYPEYTQEDVPTFRGYEVTRSLTVELRDLTKLDELFDGAVKAGANRDFGVVIDSSQREELAREATRRAIQAAKRQAAEAAKQLGVTLAGVRSVTVNPPSVSTYSAASYGPGEGFFLPGEVTVAEKVSVVFLLEDDEPSAEKEE